MWRTKSVQASRAFSRLASSEPTAEEDAPAKRRRLEAPGTAPPEGGPLGSELPVPELETNGTAAGRELPIGGPVGNGRGLTRLVANATKPVAIMGGGLVGSRPSPHRILTCKSLKSASPSSPMSLDAIAAKRGEGARSETRGKIKASLPPEP